MEYRDRITIEPDKRGGKLLPGQRRSTSLLRSGAQAVAVTLGLVFVVEVLRTLLIPSLVAVHTMTWAEILVDAAGLTLLLAPFVTLLEMRRRRAEEARDRTIAELQDALSKVKTLSGLLPICAHCKKIRSAQDYWIQIESYIGSHSEAEFSHGVCPECLREYYPDFVDQA